MLTARRAFDLAESAFWVGFGLILIVASGGRALKRKVAKS
jgi:hypothetical protein